MQNEDGMDIRTYERVTLSSPQDAQPPTLRQIFLRPFHAISQTGRILRLRLQCAPSRLPSLTTLIAFINN